MHVEGNRTIYARFYYRLDNKAHRERRKLTNFPQLKRRHLSALPKAERDLSLTFRFDRRPCLILPRLDLFLNLRLLLIQIDFLTRKNGRILSNGKVSGSISVEKIYLINNDYFDCNLFYFIYLFIFILNDI